MFTRVMFPTLYVTDQAKALDFYTQQFGFEKRFDNPGPEGWFLTIGLKGDDAQILLWPGTPPAGANGASSKSLVGPLFLESDDLRADMAALQSRGVRFVESEPEEYAYGLRATALDLDGNMLALRQTRQPT